MTSLREDGPEGGCRAAFGAVKLRPLDGPDGGWRSRAGPRGGERAELPVASGDGARRFEGDGARRGPGDPRCPIVVDLLRGDGCGDCGRDLSSRPPRTDAGRGDDLRDGFWDVTPDVVSESLGGGVDRR